MDLSLGAMGSPGEPWGAAAKRAWAAEAARILASAASVNDGRDRTTGCDLSWATQLDRLVKGPWQVVVVRWVIDS